jgi:hypothetical protein
MFEWLKGKQKRLSNYILESRVATTIDGFINHDGLAEFASYRLHVVIEKDFCVAISEPRLAKTHSSQYL